MIVTIEELTVAYEQEKRDRRPPVTTDDIPFVYEDITTEWLTNVLCAKVPGARVTAYRLGTPDDGNSNRRGLEVDYNDAGTRAGLPSALFCKASQGLANRISLAVPGAIQCEINFYNRVRPTLPIETPVCHFANLNFAFNSIVVLGAFGSDTTFCKHTTDITQERAKDQLDLLATMHGRFLESPALEQELKIFSSWVDFFGMLDYPEFAKACDKGFEVAEEVIPPRLFARRAEIWPATRQSVQAHHQLPHTLLHSDCHLRNWYITPDGRMGLTDWQAVTRGHWARDVIYTMTTSLTVENRRRWLDELLRYYGERLEQAAGRSLSFDGLLDICHQQLLTVLAFWTITINPAPGMPDMQPRDATLEFIRRIATAIDDLDALDSFARSA